MTTTDAISDIAATPLELVVFDMAGTTVQDDGCLLYTSRCV